MKTESGGSQVKILAECLAQIDSHSRIFVLTSRQGKQDLWVTFALDLPFHSANYLDTTWKLARNAFFHIISNLVLFIWCNIIWTKKEVYIQINEEQIKQKVKTLVTCWRADMSVGHIRLGWRNTTLFLLIIRNSYVWNIHHPFFVWQSAGWHVEVIRVSFSTLASTV